MHRKTAIIIGAGPAGLTAAYELLDKTDIRPIVLEATNDIGGLSKTAVYKGNRIDIGGHRFFSKSDTVMAWWQNILPLQGAPARDDIALGREVPLARESVRRMLGAGQSVKEPAPDPEKSDEVMLVRRRLSRILYQRKFFNYPISLGIDTITNLGVARICRIGLSYLKACLFPIRNEKSLEDFFVNRFGRELYKTFFRDYTEKVWGVSCAAIKPEWGAQRVKGLSIMKTLQHAAKRLLAKDASVGQKGVETSLIEQFLYPKLGPGQLWEEVARQVTACGGEVHLNRKVIGVDLADGRVRAVSVRDERSGEVSRIEGDFFFSSMPVKDLIAAMGEEAPHRVRDVAANLVYRDFITVGVLLLRLRIRNETAIPTVGGIIPDNWIYVQENDVKLGRIQVFNNWSPYMVADPDKVWLGLEYFCTEGDDLWRTPDEQLIAFAGGELARIGVIDAGEILDAVVLRVPKAYPAYFGSYDRFPEIRSFLDPLQNLFPIGRNGMHRYNNADHSMLTAITAVENVRSGRTSHENIWAVNTEETYHEEKGAGSGPGDA